MKKLTFLAFLATSILTFTACSQEVPQEEVKQEVTQSTSIMKCEPGKCGEAMMEPVAEPMKCEPGKCGANM